MFFALNVFDNLDWEKWAEGSFNPFVCHSVAALALGEDSIKMVFITRNSNCRPAYSVVSHCRISTEGKNAVECFFSVCLSVDTGFWILHVDLRKFGLKSQPSLLLKVLVYECTRED